MTVRTTKQCSQCKRTLPVDSFHQRKRMVRSGRRAACRDCTREIERQARKARSEHASLVSEDVLLKRRVRAKTRAAIARGELSRMPCRVSGCENPTQAHHLQYDGPSAHLQVEWLCQEHHAMEHTRQLDLFFCLSKA